MWSYFSSGLSCMRNKYEDLQSKSSYPVQILENTDKKKLCILPLFTQWWNFPVNIFQSSERIRNFMGIIYRSFIVVIFWKISSNSRENTFNWILLLVKLDARKILKTEKSRKEEHIVHSDS